ncbi:Sugar (and other) transporter, partial [Snodgrassella alvi SCGC AB-598-O02]
LLFLVNSFNVSWCFNLILSDQIKEVAKQDLFPLFGFRSGSGIMSGGIAPTVAAALLDQFHSWWPIAIYFGAMATVGFITTFFAPETRGRDLNAVEDAI